MANVTIAAAEPAETTVPVQPALPFPVPPLPPEFDPSFYQPAQYIIDSKQPGDIIAARQVHLAGLSVLPINIESWQLSYRSNNGRGEAIAAVTTVMRPTGDNHGKPRNLLSYQFPIDSLAHYCDPSYALQLASVPTVTGQLDVPAEAAFPLAAAQMGWAVSMPDHQGPRSAYAAGPLSGHITLDGIRAAENFAPLGLNGSATRVGLSGYSGGAIPTGHAAELRATYAPELNIVGAAEGGIAARPGAVIDMASSNAPAGLILAAAIGVSRDYPELAQYLDQHMTPLGKDLVAAKSNVCMLYQALMIPFADIRAMFDTPDGLHSPTVLRILDETNMGRRVPDVPMFMYQSNPDWIIPVGPVNDLVDRYCHDPKASIEYTRDHFSEHISLAVIAAPRTLLWLADRFAGIPPIEGCRATDVGSMALDPATWPKWADILGGTIAGLLGLPVGS
ncbi:lipase family protein [Nocardia sp. CS682]|uniref:lipase family protein n=1 Tax=Nocardia sp. CS682 TaxID=1047172 RepID=UPI0010758D1E|nr:triacylglycerol lipase [Nocardia sp. CS682]